MAADAAHRRLMHASLLHEAAEIATSRPERRSVPMPRTRMMAPALAAGLVAALVLLPFLVARLDAPSGFVFRGTLKPSGDESQYLAAVRMGAGGDWLWHDPYMSQPPGPILMYPVYLGAGHLAALLRLDVAGGFSLLHALAAAILCLALWRLAAEILAERERVWFVAFSLGAGGLYWLVALLAAAGTAPVPLNQMGSQGLSGFTALLMEGHEALGVAGQILAIAGLLGALRRRGAARAIDMVCGFLGVLLVGLSLPVLLPLTLAVLALYTGWHVWSSYRALPARAVALCLGVIALPGVALAVYYAHLFGSGPWAQGQFRGVPAIPWLEQALSWGVLLPFAVWGWRHAGRAARPVATALMIWICCALAGAQLPLWQGNRLTAGMAVACGGLFALGLIGAGVARPVRIRWLGVLVLGPLSHYLFLLMALAGGSAPHLYSTAAEDRAGHWLATHAGPGDVVLAPFGFSNVLPTIAPVRVVAGHTYQTLDLALRQGHIDTVYGPGGGRADRLRAIRDSGATLVVYDPLDTENGSFDPGQLPAMRVLFRSAGLAIMRPPGRS